MSRLLSACLFIFLSCSIFSVKPLPPSLQDVGVSENLKGNVPLELLFTDPIKGNVKLQDLVREDQTTILNLVYYSCPMLCNLVTTGLAESLRGLPFPIGEKYNVVTLSFNPEDSVDQALGFRDRYIDMLGQPEAEDHWYFLTGDEASIQSLTDSVGFYARKEMESGEFAHNAVLIFINPEGKISRYLYGISFKPNDVKLAITETLDKKYQTAVERLLLFCYNYDPQTRGYTLFARNVMKVAGAITVFGIILMIVILSRRR